MKNLSNKNSDTDFTILGGSGFIGEKLINHLQKSGYNVYAPSRNDEIDKNKNLGHVIYAIGLTGDFRTRPYDTIEAHVSKLAKLLKETTFDSWLYLSSTRIYANLNSDEVASESARIPVTLDDSSLYDLSKMLGESLCLTQKSNKIRVARLANVYGNGQNKNTFLGSVLTELLEHKSVVINESPDSCKDYISINDVVNLLIKISISGKSNIYNVASGISTRHADLANKLSNIDSGKVSFKKGAHTRKFPNIDITNVITEFSYSPSCILSDLAKMYADIKNNNQGR